MPTSIDEFNKFVWNLATRYRGRIQAYEVWNEPQNVQFFSPYTSTELNTLATMTTRAYNTIKACDAAALVLAASVLPRASSGGTTLIISLISLISLIILITLIRYDTGRRVFKRDASPRVAGGRHEHSHLPRDGAGVG
jgi:hypothetical protein